MIAIYIQSSRSAFNTSGRLCAEQNKGWLRQLTLHIIDEIARVGLPREFLDANGGALLEEDFADNAFTYISIQLMRIGKREDGWHIDGGTSLLHAALTLFGHREMPVELEDQNFPKRRSQAS